MPKTILIRPDGEMVFVHDDDLLTDLVPEKRETYRASNVEFDNEMQAWKWCIPYELGGMHGMDRERSVALAQEVNTINESLAMGGVPPGVNKRTAT